jgi:hypothetical protein
VLLDQRFDLFGRHLVFSLSAIAYTRMIPQSKRKIRPALERAEREKDPAALPGAGLLLG